MKKDPNVEFMQYHVSIYPDGHGYVNLLDGNKHSLGTAGMFSNKEEMMEIVGTLSRSYPDVEISFHSLESQ